MLICGGFNPNLAGRHAEGRRDILFHALDVRKDFWLLRDHRRIHIHDPRLPLPGLARGLFQENFAGRPVPARIAVWEKMTNINLAQSAQDRIDDRVHEHIGIGMAIKAFAMRDVHSTQDEFAPWNKRVNIVTNANMNHAPPLWRRRFALQ